MRKESFRKDERIMATILPTTNGHSAQDGENNFAVKVGLARMLKGGVIMDVVNAEQVLYPFPSPEIQPANPSPANESCPLEPSTIYRLPT